MKKRLFTFLLVCVISVANLVPAKAAGAPDLTIYINGKIFNPAGPVMVINSTTYVPIGEFSKELSPDVAVSWDEGSQTAYVSNSSVSVSGTIGDQFLIANGRYFYLPDGCFMYNRNVMVPLREVSKAFGASVQWNGDTNTVNVKSGSGTLKSGDAFYDSEALYWLARIISCESGGEPLSGQIAVGNVVLNRVYSGNYADSVYGVIFQPNQFYTSVNSGAVYRDPREISVIAAKICLEGYNVVGNSLYFCNPNRDDSDWFKRCLTCNAVIGNHAFYS